MASVNKKLYGTVMEQGNLVLPPRAGRDNKRDAILRIALTAFLTDGYAGTSMSSIAARLGGSKATLYSYFASKEELFAAVIAERCQDIMAIVIEAGDGPGDFKTKLLRLGERIIGFALSDEKIAIYRLITAETARFPELGRAFYQSGPAEGKRFFSEYFARAIADGHLKSADTITMASHFFELCTGDLHHRKLWNVIPDPSEAEIRLQVARAVDVFLAAYGAAPSV